MHSLIRTLAAVLPLAAAAAPSGGASARSARSTPGCTSLSFGDFAWTVQSFTYHAQYTFSTPAHQVSSGSVRFNLTNPALPETAVCAADSTQLTDFFYGDFVYHCQAPATGSGTATTFAFSRPSGLLTVNQTWTCRDEDPQYPVTFTGYGAVNLTLDCNTTNYQNPDWQSGEIYSSRTINCAPLTLPLTPHDKTAVA
ncbi:hypothetical protein F4802DRAFT_601587 [Xylaria palmicola]|nr:hypothetical protein F4802DRAFT_601587 [Xylaria palmicola]